MMQDILTFLHAHWELASLFFVILIYIVYEESRSGSGQNSVSPQACVNLMNHEHALVWDIRPMEHFSAGHIVGAQAVATDALVERWQSLSKGQRKKPIVVVCQRGIGASKAAQQLQKTAGDQRVVFLQGGMEQWQRDQLPVTTKSEK